jgi:hypothetical protein
MYLSPCYSGLTVYGVIHHPNPINLDEVEFVREKFFHSPESASKWFRRKFKKSRRAAYNNPEIVKVTGLLTLQVEPVVDYDKIMTSPNNNTEDSCF